jgi:hypothetical protein
MSKIPENLRIYSRKPEEFKMDAMHNSAWRKNNIKKHVVKARKGFAVDHNSTSFQNTAEKWSNANPYLAKTLDKWDFILDLDTDLFEDTPNDPIKIRIITLEFRGDGGRAYKVVDEKNYCWDLREDVLLDAMIEVGISPGGWVNGEFVWATIGSQMKLIRVGSSLYDSLLEVKSRSLLKKIPAKDLIPGHLYKTANGKEGVFLGFVNIYGKGKHQTWMTSYNVNKKYIELGILGNSIRTSWTKNSSYIEDCGYFAEFENNWVQILRDSALEKLNHYTSRRNLFDASLYTTEETDSVISDTIKRIIDARN